MTKLENTMILLFIKEKKYGTKKRRVF